MRDGLADYRPEYRAPNVEFTTGGGVETMSADYDKTGVRVGTDKIQIHPNYVEYRADRMAHMVRHENAHRAVEVLQSKVEARDGREAALAWRQRVDRAAVDWMTSALDEVPSDLRLEYGRLHRKFAEQQTRGHGSPPDEAFADLVGYLAAGESMPGDTSPVLALIREAEPGGIFAGGIPELGAQDRRLPTPAGRSPGGGQPVEPVKGAGEPTTAASVPNGSGGMVRPIVASGRFRDMRAKNFSDPPTGAAELHQRMRGDTPWTEEQAKAYQVYSLDDYRRINDVARGRRKTDSVTAEQSAAMRAGMRPIPDNVIAYRTVHPEAFGFPGTHDKLTDAELQGLVGRVFHDPAPTSTSLNSRMNRVLQLRIKVPAGTRGAYIADVSSAKTEYEMLLDFGTHYKIDGFTRTPNGDTVLNLTVVGQDEQPV